MFAIALVRDNNESLVKSFLVNTRLVTTNQQNRLPFRIERKGDPPNFAIPTETKLLQVGMLRPLERIDSRTAKTRAKFPQQKRMSKQFVLQTLGHQPKFGVEFIA